MKRAAWPRSVGFGSLVLGGLLAAAAVRAVELPRPTYANSVVFSIQHDVTDATTVDLLKSKYGGGLYVELSISTFAAPDLGWHASLATADSDLAMVAFSSQVGLFVAAAAAEGVNLHIGLSDGLSRAVSMSHEAKVEDVRNAQWYNSNNLIPGDTPPDDGAMDTVIFGTFSRYARKLQQFEDAKWHAAFKYLAAVIAANPAMTIVVSAPGEAELNFNGANWATSVQAVFCDYSPFTALEFRDWITHEGLYAPGGRYDGDGWPGGGAKYQGAAGLTQFDTDFGTSFTTWDLEYFNWSLADPFDSDNTDAFDEDPRCIPFDSYVHGGMMPADGAGFTPGGFDPPRVMFAKGTDPFWDLWQTFRETLVYHHVRDIIAIARAEGIPADRLFTHQIPADYLWGTYPDYPTGNNNRYYSSGSPLWSADMGALSGLGVTCYDLHFPAGEARTSQWLLGALAARSSNWALMEYNPETIPDGFADQVTIAPAADIYDQMMRAYRAGVHFLNFFLWRGPIEWAYEGTPREDALDMFFAAVKDTARQPAGTTFTPPVPGGVSATYEAATDRVVVSWSPLIWPDLAYRWEQWGGFGGFAVCRGTAPDFPCTAATTIGRTALFEWADTTFDRSRPVYYKVVTANSFGEEGPVAATGRVLPREGPVAVLGLGRSALAFGGAGSAVSTGPQDLVIENSGTADLNWTIRVVPPEVTWVRPSTASGTNTAVVAIGVAPDLAPGTYTASLVVEDPAALCSPQTVAITYTVRQAGSPPFGYIDSPADGAVGVVGAVPITGWALDDVEVKKVILWRDPFGGEPPTNPNGLVYIGEATIVAGQRPDVEAAYPAMPMAYRGAWGYSLLSNLLPAGGNGSYRVHVYVEDAEGHQVYLGARRFTASNATATKPFGTIDTPAQGATISGAGYVSWGWALTPQPGVIPLDGSTITVYIDGVAVGHPSYGYPRPDIDTLFPGLGNSGQGVGYSVIDTTALANGVHTIVWGVTDNLGRAEGLGSRYFWVLN